MESLSNFVGCLHSEIECSHIISLAMDGVLTRLKRRLTEKEKRLIRPGHAFIYLEEESGIIRWTDSKSWTPSRALGPFMMYIEKSSEPPLIKKIYTAKYQDKIVHIVIYNLYNHEERGVCCEIYSDIRSEIIPEVFSKMARTHLNDKKKRNQSPKNIIQDKLKINRESCEGYPFQIPDDHFGLKERYFNYTQNQYMNTQYGGFNKIYEPEDNFLSKYYEVDLSFDNSAPVNLSLSHDKVPYLSIEKNDIKVKTKNDETDNFNQ